MKSSLIVTGVVVVLGFIVLMSGRSNFNTFVDMEENVENAWGKVQSSYQRRADLIPNLVSTVKASAVHEKETLEAVVSARAKASNITIDPSNVTPEQMKKFQEAQSGLSQSLGRLMMISEKYPDLKANKAFSELQSQLEGTENRIKVARDRFNDSATTYNKQIRHFPASFYASVFGFADKAQFQAQEGAENAPKVEF